MKNRINKIISLDDGSKYMVIDQGNYNQKAYYFTSKLDQEENLTDNFTIMEITMINGEEVVSPVKEEKVFRALIDYFKDRNQ